LQASSAEATILPDVPPGAETRLVALACSEPLEDQARWTLRLLIDRLVELEIMEAVSFVAVRRILKNALKSHLRKQWPIPPQSNAECVWRMYSTFHSN
jgi:hypothetical protein